MTTISMRMPEDVIEELKEIAPKLGFSGYQPLIRAYIGRGLRADAAELARLELAEPAEPIFEERTEAATPPVTAVYILRTESIAPRKPEAREHKVEKVRAMLLASAR